MLQTVLINCYWKSIELNGVTFCWASGINKSMPLNQTEAEFGKVGEQVEK